MIRVFIHKNIEPTWLQINHTPLIVHTKNVNTFVKKNKLMAWQDLISFSIVE